MSDIVEKQILETLKLMEKSLRGISSLPTQSSANKPAAKPKVSPVTNSDKEQKNFKNSLATASKTLSALTSRQKELDELYRKYISMTESDLRDSEEGRKIAEKYHRALENYAKDLDEGSDETLKMAEYQKLVYKSLEQQQNAIVYSIKGTQALGTQIGQAARKASLLSASLIQTNENFKDGTAEYSAWMNELRTSTKGLNSLGKNFLKSAGMVDEVTGDLRENLSTKDFAALRLKIGEAQEAIAESFAGLSPIGVNNLNDAIARIKDLSSKIEAPAGSANASTNPEADSKELNELNLRLGQLAEKLSAAGVDMGNFSDLFDENGKLLTDQLSSLEARSASLGEHLSKAEATINTTAKAQDHLGKVANTAAGKLEGFALAYRNDPTGTMFSKLRGKLGSTIAILGGLSKTVDGLKGVFSDIQNFNISHVPETFYEVQKASVKMGMSFEDTIKFMQENKRVLALYGSEGFKGFVGNVKDTFAKFGYTMKQGAELVGPSIEAGIASGINVRSADSLNKFIDKTMDSFKDISGIVNLTAKEYIALNAELLNSKDVTDTLMGMDQQRAQAYAQDLISMRNEYVQRGLSIQQAQELLKVQQSQQREKVTSRVTAAAKGMALAQQVGVSSEDAVRYQQLSLKGNKTDAEFKELQEISNKIAKGAEERRVNSYDQSTGAGLATDIMLENLTPDGALKQMMEKGQEINKADRANIGVTSEQARAKGDEAQGKESVATLGNAANSVASVLDNNLTKAALGASAALMGLALQGGLSTFVNILKSGGSILGRTIGGIGSSVMSAGSSILSGAGTVGSTLARGAGALGSTIASGAGALGSTIASTAGTVGSTIASGASAVGSTIAAGAKGLMGGAGVGLLGMAGEMAGDALKERGHEKTGAAVSALGTTAKYAGMGAAIGSVIPGVGTAIGGAVGGIYGAYKGITENAEGLSKIASSVTDWFGFTGDKKPEAKMSEPPQTPTPPVAAVTAPPTAKTPPEATMSPATDSKKSMFGTLSSFATAIPGVGAIAGALGTAFGMVKGITEPAPDTSKTVVDDKKVKPPVKNDELVVAINKLTAALLKVTPGVTDKNAVSTVKDTASTGITSMIGNVADSLLNFFPMVKAGLAAGSNLAASLGLGKDSNNSIFAANKKAVDQIIGGLNNDKDKSTDSKKINVLQPSVDVKPDVKVTQPSVDIKPDAKLTQPSVDVKPDAKVVNPSVDVKPDAKVVNPSVDVKPDAKVVNPSVDVKPDAKLTQPSIDVKPDAKVVNPSVDVKPDAKLTQPSVDVKPDAKVVNPSVDVKPAIDVKPETKVDQPVVDIKPDAKIEQPFVDIKPIDPNVVKSVESLVDVPSLAVPAQKTLPSIVQPASLFDKKEINTKSEKNSKSDASETPETMEMSDPTSHEHLVAIATSMAEAVKLLTQIAANSSQSKTDVQSSFPTITPSIPTVFSYVTGRQQ